MYYDYPKYKPSNLPLFGRLLGLHFGAIEIRIFFAEVSNSVMFRKYSEYRSGVRCTVCDSIWLDSLFFISEGCLVYILNQIYRVLVNLIYSLDIRSKLPNPTNKVPVTRLNPFLTRSVLSRIENFEPPIAYNERHVTLLTNVIMIMII